MAPSIPRSRAAAAYDRKSSVIIRSGAKLYFFQEPAHQFQRRMLVSFGLDKHIKNLAFGVDGSPEIDNATANPQINFVKMPRSVRLWAALAQIRSDHRPKMIHPASNCLIGNRDSAFRQQILSNAKTQGEPMVEPLLDDLGREMVPAITDFSHLLECGAAWENTSLAARDNAL